MPTALEYIHDCAELLGRYDRRVTTGAGSDTTLVCADYVNSVLAASEFANFAVLIETGVCAGEQGMITNTGLTRASGTLTTADAFTDDIASGVTFSLYDCDRLPAIRKGTRPGLLQMASQALERTWAEDTISVTGVSDQVHYIVDTITHPWFTDDTRIIEIQMPVDNADYIPTILPRERWSWVSDGETKKLRFLGGPFRTGQSFTIKVNRPGNSRLKINGVWTDQTSQTAALTSLTDEALVDVNVLRPMMLSRAYAQLAANGAPGRTVEEWLALSTKWEAVAVGKKQRRLPRDANDGVFRMRSAAVRGGGPYGMAY